VWQGAGAPDAEEPIRASCEHRRRSRSLAGKLLLYEGKVSEQPAQRDEPATNSQFGGFRWTVGTATLAWTDGLCRLLAVDRRQAIPGLATLTAMLHIDDRQRFAEMLRIAGASGHVQVCDVRARTGDGRTICCRIEVQPEVGAGKSVSALVGIVQDITEIGRPEQALRRSQSLLRVLIDAIPAAITVKDRDGRFVLVNSYEGTTTGRP
jgi:two-component system, chemotaxis family, CheB/CheR fusion protein